MNAGDLVRFLVSRSSFPLAALVAGVVAHPASAGACSVGALTIWQSYPASDAIGVPTNIVPILYTDGSQQDLIMRRADGTPVAVEVSREDLDGYRLRPLSELEPLTDYELVFGTARLPFQTGEGPAPVPEELTVPDFRATRVSYRPDSRESTCGPTEFVCGATTSVGTLFEVRVGADVMLSDSVDDPNALLLMAPVYGAFVSSDECLDIYARDVRGGRSAPLTLCGDEIAVIDIGGLPPPGIDCSEALAIAEREPGSDPSPSSPTTIEATDMGCGFSPAAPGRGADPWPLASALGLLALNLLRRRQR